ncbi:MAG: ABC transporter ATP-binding protein [Methanobacteriota archaeon]
MTKEYAIEVRSVTKTYRTGKSELHALKNVSIQIEKGEFVALIGRSGSGKSTLMNLLGCLDRPTSGNIFIDGQNTSQLTDRMLAEIRGRKMGFIFQTFNLVPTLSALKNIMLPMVFGGFPRASREQRSVELLRRMELEKWASHLPSELSGGQQQRIAIARALANNPLIILADEPTGNLDSKTGEQVMEFLSSINREGKTIVLVTHDPILVRYARRVITLSDGEVVDRHDV